MATHFNIDCHRGQFGHHAGGAGVVNVHNAKFHFSDNEQTFLLQIKSKNGEFFTWSQFYLGIRYEDHNESESCVEMLKEHYVVALGA